MSGGAVIGSLRGVLILDASNWSPAISRARGDLSGLRGAMQDVARVVEELGSKFRSAGAAMTAGITAPLAVLGAASNKTASSFESAMKTVESALGRVSGKELEQLADQAKALGPAVGKSAIEAVSGMDALARAGLTTTDILGGGLKSTLQLASAGMADVAPSAALVTDAMGQFKLTASQLPYVVGSVVGALDASKFGFVDFQQAIAQGGGAAASASMSFRDFSTAIAATSTQFSSGSDAGTSFKTYLARLVPASKEAEAAMKALNLRFFDAEGRMKPLAEQAEMLRSVFKNLSTEDSRKALGTIFGDDAFRTALGLIDQGRVGIERLQQTIASGDVEGKIAKRLEGEAAATTRLATAWEGVKIAIGEVGLTQIITSVKNAIASLLESFANAPPIILKIGVAFGAIASAAGPMILIFSQIASFFLPLIAARFGIVGLAISALVNPLGTVTLLVGRLIAGFAQGAVLARIGALFTGLLTPLGLITAAVTVLTIAWQANEARVAASRAEQDRLRATMNGAKPALDKAAIAVADLSGKTGDAAKAARDHANALLTEARAAVIAARAIAQKRVAAAQSAVAEAQRYERNSPSSILADPTATFAATQAQRAYRQQAKLAREEAVAAVEGLNTARTQLNDLNAAVNAPPPAIRRVSLDDSSPKTKTPKAQSSSTAVPGGAYADMNREQLRAQAELEAARERGDKETVQALSDRLALSQQIEAYQRTGLSLDKARAEAQRDMRDIQAARAVSAAREIESEQASVALDAARMGSDRQLEQSLERQAELKRRITFYYEQTKNLAEATRLAEADQAKVDEARAGVRRRWLADDAQDRAVRIAQLRGASEVEVRALQRVVDIRQRARDLEAQNIAPADAMAQATAEWSEEDKARMRGNFRATFRDGVYAALDGSLGDFFKSFWRDRVAKGMEEALNSLSSLIQRLFANVKIGEGGSGGGLFSAIGKALGLVGSGNSRVGIAGPASLGSSALDLTPIKLPAFNTGGSFKVGGMSGIDQNVVAFRATKGEMVDIRKPGNDNGGGGKWIIEASPYFDVRAAGAARPETQAMGTQAAAGGARIAASDAAKRKRRRLG